jgi:CRISPR-associated endonuclease/helicase Cas3
VKQGGDSLEFWARPSDFDHKHTWQPLKDHLAAVANQASKLAEPFGAEEIAWVTGLCHDLGKYSREFQRRLEDPRVRVDHSTAGAATAFHKYGAVGRLIAYAIAGHHSGLPNGGGALESDLFHRVKYKQVADFSSYSSELRLPDNVRGPVLRPQSPESRGFTLAFFTRMLFSCLVDADSLDAEAFGDPQVSALRGVSLPLAVLEQRLLEYIDRVTASASRTRVNEKRAEVLRDCLQAAEHPRGLFTLTVPTGGGKTLSSLAFALKHARLHGLRRIIYAIPFTSIIEQNAGVFRKAVGEEAVLEHHSNVALPDNREDGWRSSLELAEQNWDAPLVVTTNVQFFESLFSSRPGRCRKLHNIAKSVVILDEAQMLPVELLKPCIAAICELVNNYGVSVVLCSATQPALEGLFPKGMQVREVTRDPASLYLALNRVEVHNMGTASDEDVVTQILGQKQVLCIVNTRAHARKLFEQLGRADGHYHLSAAMYPKHRLERLNEIRQRLREGLVCRVVSTQLIEAGVDVDFPVVIRAMAGIDSIAQAAGRCNREGKAERGQVYVFSPAGGEGMSHIWFKRTASIAASVMNRVEDPLGLGSVKQYFQELYFYEGGTLPHSCEPTGLDRHGILDRIEVGAKPLDFPFREIADLFKVIGDETVGVIVPGDERCRKLLEKVRYLGISRQRVRNLQQYTVSVRPWELKGLQEAGVLSDVGGLAVLSGAGCYDSVFGLRAEPAERKEADAWIY